MNPEVADRRLEQLAQRVLEQQSRLSELIAHYQVRFGDDPRNRASVNLLEAQRSFAQAVDYIGRSLYWIAQKKEK